MKTMHAILSMLALFASLSANGEQIDPEQILVGSAELRLPSELSTATRVKLVVDNKEGKNDIDLKVGGKWIFKKDELGAVSNKVVWLAFSWDKEIYPQIFQVQTGRVLIFADILNLTYRFSIPLDKFLSGLWKPVEAAPTDGDKPAEIQDRGYAGFRYDVAGDTISVHLVLEGSPAEIGGLRKGDKIVSFQGNKVADPEIGAEDGFQRAITKWKAGDHVTFEVERDAEILKIDVTLIPFDSINKIEKSEQAVLPNGP